MKLKHEKRSHIKPGVVYGKQGEQLNLISNRGNVLIVEGQAGQRFPVNREEVTEADVVTAIEPINNFSKPGPAAKPAKGRKQGPQNQNTLF